MREADMPVKGVPATHGICIKMPSVEMGILCRETCNKPRLKPMIEAVSNSLSTFDEGSGASDVTTSRCSAHLTSASVSRRTNRAFDMLQLLRISTR
jgi:hypothetical protein